MKRSVVICLIFCLMIPCKASVLQAADEDAAKSPEKKAWKEVDSLNKKSIQAFIRNYPDADLAKDARVALELQDKFTSIREGKSKDDFTIPSAMLGEKWKAWQKKDSNKDVIGYFARQKNNFTTQGWFTPAPLSGGKTGKRKILSFDERGILVSPTGDGSIIAFRTGGLKFELLNKIVFETPGNDPIYFGVLKGKGLIHLKGAGKITLPDGVTKVVE
ncbi:MAG TPA: hypothetical protein VMU10_10975 [Desulfomonilia bacterium]|nr:hypothetical protein [Desulfomonilia bacterium]